MGNKLIEIKDRTKVIFTIDGKEVIVAIRNNKLNIEGSSSYIIEPIGSNNINIEWIKINKK